jgi:hypothetical protein
LVTMATATILNLFNPPKSCHTLRWIFLQSFMKFDERNQNFFFFKSPLFCFSISRRWLDQTLWNLVEISYAMWSCAFKGLFFHILIFSCNNAQPNGTKLGRGDP